VVSQSTDGDLGGDINMILRHSSFLSFDLIQVYVVLTFKHLTRTDVIVWQNVTSVGILYELQKTGKCVRGGNFFPTLTVLKCFLYVCIIYPQKISSKNQNGSMVLQEIRLGL
jgi:hypothetical protein